MNKRTPLTNAHMKYVDDLSLVQSLNLRECLVPNPDPNPARPLAYHDRTHHLLPTDACQLQEEINRLVTYSENNQMRINADKCKVMIFNTGRKYNGMPRLTLSGEGGDYLEVVETFKLLGVIIRSDMKWYDNTSYICKKGYARLWMLRRLKGLGASEEEMLDVYVKQVRSVLELAVPVWQPSLTQAEVKQIERVQKCAFFIILGENYTHYEDAIDLLECKSLDDRRVSLCENFVRKSSKSFRFQNWFCGNTEAPLPFLLGKGRRKSYQSLNLFPQELTDTRTLHYRI